MLPIEALRWGWLAFAVAGAVRAYLNLRNVSRARKRILRSGINGVLKVRARFTVWDCAISCGALICGCFAGVAAILAQPMVALTSLILEHLLLVWLVFNMAKGWTEVNRALLDESLAASIMGEHGRVRPT